MVFSFDEMTDMIFAYAKCNRNAQAAQTMYSEMHPNGVQPSRNYFQKLERKLRSNGSFTIPRSRKSVVTTVGGDKEVDILGKLKTLKLEDLSLKATYFSIC